MALNTNDMLRQGFETFDMTANAFPSISAGVHYLASEWLDEPESHSSDLFIKA